MSAIKRDTTRDGVRLRYNLAAEHAAADLAQAFADDYMDVIIRSIVNQPRSLQKRIGPSEMGVECARAILHKLNGDQEPDRGNTPWKPTIGTSVHNYLETAFTKANTPTQIRWGTEHRVTVGTVAGIPITGSADLFDDKHGVVGDHKIVGKSMLASYRANGPGEQYRRQAHLYGRGFEALGLTVRLVAICFLPREGELDDTFIWTEPYNQSLAIETVERVDALAALLAAVGVDQAVAQFAECDNRWCRWCGTGNSFGKQPLAGSTADLFGLG